MWHGTADNMSVTPAVLLINRLVNHWTTCTMRSSRTWVVISKYPMGYDATRYVIAGDKGTRRRRDIEGRVSHGELRWQSVWTWAIHPQQMNMTTRCHRREAEQRRGEAERDRAQGWLDSDNRQEGIASKQVDKQRYWLSMQENIMIEERSSPKTWSAVTATVHENVRPHQ